MLKRKSFENEREARLFLWANGSGGPEERRGRIPHVGVSNSVASALGLEDCSAGVQVRTTGCGTVHCDCMAFNFATIAPRIFEPWFAGSCFDSSSGRTMK